MSARNRKTEVVTIPVRVRIRYRKGSKIARIQAVAYAKQILRGTHGYGVDKDHWPIDCEVLQS